MRSSGPIRRRPACSAAGGTDPYAMRELIVTFHGLGDPPSAVSDSERKVWIPVDWLQAILDALPPDGVRLAFDDSNASDVDHALPALSRRGRRAQFFVLAGELGEPGRLAVEDVSRLLAAGMGIGSHGLHHRNWRAISDEELDRELVESRRELSRIADGEVAEAACPFGSYDRRVLRALREAGYKRAYTSDGGSSSPAGWLAARTTITRDRPLREWLDLVAFGPARNPDPVQLVKRYVKRIR
jgi:peptidoglycan/xylan/chitin deacetylase (PgdA/CDA1 family)